MTKGVGGKHCQREKRFKKQQQQNRETERKVDPEGDSVTTVVPKKYDFIVSIV